MQVRRISQMKTKKNKKNIDSKTEITIHDDPSDKGKDILFVEEVVDNDPGGSLIVSDQLSNGNIRINSNNVVFFDDSISRA